jgi:hypothetical protein
LKAFEIFFGITLLKQAGVVQGVAGMNRVLRLTDVFKVIPNPVFSEEMEEP